MLEPVLENLHCVTSSVQDGGISFMYKMSVKETDIYFAKFLSLEQTSEEHKW